MAIMGILLVAAEAVEEHRSGFGINLDILETNLINLLIIYGVLFYFGRGFLGKTLSERKAAIESEIKEAEDRKKTASAALSEQQQKLAQAQAEATRIRQEAGVRAQAKRDEVLAQAQEDIARMQAAAAQDVTTQQEKIISELRQRIAAQAMEKAEAELRSRLDGDRQQQIVERSIALIGGAS